MQVQGEKRLLHGTHVHGWRSEAWHREDSCNSKHASTRKPSSSSKASRNDKLLEQVHQGLQWKNSHTARASPQRCHMELDWNPSASIWQTERWSHKSSCAEILRCRKACGVVCWRVQKRAWCCLPPGQCSSSLCFESSFRCRNQICTDRKGTPCGCVCMQKVSWLHLRLQSDHRNWSQAFDHHREEATSCCPSTLTENASSASAVWPTVCLQEGKRAFPCWHPLKSIPGWTPRRDRIWVWRHDSAVHLSRQDDRASARNSGRCNHAEVGEVHQGRLAWTWAKCSTWCKTLLAFPRRARDWKWRHPERTKGYGAQIFAVGIHCHFTQASHGCRPHQTACSDVVYWPKMRQDIKSASCFSVFCMQQLQSPSPEANPHQSPCSWPSLGNCWSRHFWLEQPPVPGHGGFLLWLVWDGFTAWQLLKDSDLQDEAPVFDSRHSREAVDRQWQAVRQPWIWAVCQGMELCTHYKQPILCTVKRFGWKCCQASKTAVGEMQKRWVWCSVGSPEPAEHTKQWHGFSSPASALHTHPHHTPDINEAAETQATEISPTAETIPRQVSTTSAAFETQWSGTHADRQRLPETCSGEVNSRQSQVIHSYFWRSRLCSEQTTSSSGLWTQTIEQSARQLRNWSATATSQWWSPYNWRSEAANCASPVHCRQSFAAFYTAATQEPTYGYSAWLSTAFICTTIVPWGVTRCLLHQGLLRFRARHNPAVSLWWRALGESSDQIQNTLTLDLVLTHKHAHIHSHSQT